MTREQAMAEIATLANPECAEINISSSYLADRLAASMEIYKGVVIPTDGTLYWLDWIKRCRWSKA